jgi:hypothetical protein
MYEALAGALPGKAFGQVFRRKARMWQLRQMSPYLLFAAFDVTTDYTVKHQKEFEHG